MGHWCVVCTGCNKENIFSEDNDIRANIGKHGPICRYCGKGLDCRPRPKTAKSPASGYYAHKRPDRFWEHCGYHIPQCVHPRHTDIPHKWKTLVGKMEDMPEAQFDNECLAISSDVGAKLVTEDQLKNCAQLEHRSLDRIRGARQSGEWEILVSATDWSGKGSSKKSAKAIEETGLEYNSYTAHAVVGLRRGADVPEVVYLDRMPYDSDYVKDAESSVNVYMGSGADIYAHDFTGAGSVKETLVKQYGIGRGMNMNNIMPVFYTSNAPNKPILHFDSQAGAVQHYYSMDKHRALMLVALLLQRGKLLLPKWGAPAPNGKESMGDLISDWLSLFEEVHDSPRGKKMITIQKDPDRPDDVAQAITMACCCCWHVSKRWPELSQFVSQRMAWDNADDPEADLPMGVTPGWEAA